MGRHGRPTSTAPRALFVELRGLLTVPIRSECRGPRLQCVLAGVPSSTRQEPCHRGLGMVSAITCAGGSGIHTHA